MGIFDCTGVILAGGLNSRMNGVNKALLDIGGQSIMERTLALFDEIFGRVLVVSNNPLDFMGFDVKIVSDLFPERCSLAGIHAALFHAETPWIFVAPCDNPFLSREMVELVLSHRTDGATIVVPETTKGLEPLCAAYSRENLTLAENRLAEGRYKIQSLFRKKRTRKVAEEKIRRIDPELRSFFNINTPEDYRWALDMLARKGNG
ncbi:molybdenum cofactor guanylyltransferase [Desulfoluna spongiiphila]|uniref:molybdenum cofactor guanylyltransferase n=1 Tax=Desulfoluna spongiiphila TaxID=419481 RepID=UPI0012574499|nr:molybdenum cofactor guanylyltransferase [Desulfoluna spongiiphila]VVS92936.1 nucleotide-diphospho-sugar transferases [Desulfoluna spongiiphila]